MNEKTIKQAILDLTILRDVAKAFATISSSRIRKNRDQVLYSRSFLSSLNDIFSEVIYHYRNRVMELAKRRNAGGKEKITFLPHNGRSVAVLLSANTGLYGDVMQRTFELFLSETRKRDSEVTIVGHLGLSQFLSEEPAKPYTFFDLSDSGVSREQLSELIYHLVQYEEIFIYYPKFKNIVEQIPDVFNISANTPIPNIDSVRFDPASRAKFGEEKRMYFFEPSIEKILVFFEAEIFSSMFEQSISESNLAKHASRMLAMDRAGEKVKEGLTKLAIEKLRINHYILNKKQQGLLVPVMIFGQN